MVNQKQKNKKRQWRRRASTKRLIACITMAGALLISLFFTHQINILLKFDYDYSHFAPHTYEVHFVDVGQGDATLIRFSNGKTMMVDSGPSGAKENLINYINNVFFRNSKKVFNYVVLTHGDSDHMGNMLYILENYNIEVFYQPTHTEGTANYLALRERLQEKAALKNIQLKNNASGEEIIEGDEKVTWLTPTLNYYNSTNDYSPIMLVELSNCKLMLTGDATSEIGEKEATHYFLDEVDIDILKLGHHGSNTSTSLIFLEAFTPEIAIVSCSLFNSYGHPSFKMLERLAEYDQLYNKNISNYLSTAEGGNIIFHINILGEMDNSLLDNVNNYTFVSWIYIALPSAGVLIIFAFVPVKVSREQWQKLQKNKLKKFAKK